MIDYDDEPITVCARGDHTWVAGMMYVHAEDVASVAVIRDVACERCEKVYAEGDEYAD